MTQTLINDGLQSIIAGMVPERDKAQTVSYVAPTLTSTAYLTAYRTTPWARKIIDRPAKDAFRKWRQWNADPNQITSIEREEKRLQLKAKLTKAYRIARLTGKAHAYFDLGDDPSQPVNLNAVRAKSIRFITVLADSDVSPGVQDDDPMSPYYGTPANYLITSVSKGAVYIHPSRMVTFYGADIPEGERTLKRADSVLAAVMTTLHHHDATMANIASLIFEAKVDVITVPGLARMLADPVQSDQVLERFRLMALGKGNNGTVLINGPESADVPGEMWEQKTQTFATLPDLIDRFQLALAGAADMPRALLFGVSAGGLGSTGDLELSAYYDRINDLQSNEIQPAMDILDECLIRSALGNRPEEIHYLWNSLWQISDKEKAEIGQKIAETASKLEPILGREIIAEPTVNALTEAGLFPGLEQSYADFIAAGGEIEPAEEEDDIVPKMTDDQT